MSVDLSAMFPGEPDQTAPDEPDDFETGDDNVHAPDEKSGDDDNG